MGSAPNRLFVVIWQDVRHLLVSGNFLSFEIILSEADNSITFQYADVVVGDPAYDYGASATVGIESPYPFTPFTGLQYSYNEPALINGRAIKFWIPPVLNNDVGVKGIIAPRGLVSFRSPSIVPKAIVRNHGRLPQTFPVRCSIFGTGGVLRYASEVNVAGLDSGAVDTIEFATWNISEIETCFVRMRTFLSGDEDTTNDAKSQTTIIIRAYFTGGPDEGFMRWIDSDTTGGPVYNWRDISQTGTPVPFPYFDDDVARIPIGFNFTFYDRTYNRLTVGTNGALSFDSVYITLSNDSIPNPAPPKNLIAALWDDLHCIQLGRVKYQTVGTSPNCTLVISYDNIAYYGGGDSTLTFQILLLEGSNDIIIQYADVITGHPGECDTAKSATVGIEDPNGTIGLCYLYNAKPYGNLITSGRAIRFYFLPPGRDVGVAKIISPPANLLPGDTAIPKALVKNYGTEDQSNLPVRCVIRDTAGNIIYNQEVTIPFLRSGDSAVAQFPEWAPGEGVYYDTIRTLLGGDERPANDYKGMVHNVSFWAEVEVGYDDGGNEANYWVQEPSGTDDRFAVKITPPVANYQIKAGKFCISASTVPLSFADCGVYPESAGIPRLSSPIVTVPNQPTATTVIPTVNWEIVNFGNVRVSSPNDVFLVVHWPSGSYDGPYVAADATYPDLRSYWSMTPPPGEWNLWTSHDWMMRLIFRIPGIDAGVAEIRSPRDTIEIGIPTTPEAVVWNYGFTEKTFKTFFHIANDSNLVYADTVELTLPGNTSQNVTFAQWTPTQTGTFQLVSATLLANDLVPENDTAKSQVFVRSTGMGEFRKKMATGLRILSNPTKGLVKVYYTLPEEEVASLKIYNALGEVVYSEKSDKGVFIIKELPAGIYLLRFEAKGERVERKLIVVK
uniref:T9SS type A sorting domain-containing protein n=1 Tax=candidate division WOR-3 bacterium TaxID=2052148 RepID=A0A7C3UWZ2_UNCW3